jgi:hypothetical protein
VIAWTGRVICWAALIYGLQRLARHWGIPIWASTAGIVIWLAAGQSVVGGEWMIGTFEAKCVAYICLLFSLDAFIRERSYVAAVLLGLTFSFHPAVGAWSILAVGAGLIYSRWRLVDIVKTAAITLLCCAPGLVPLVTTASSRAATDDWRFLELVRFPHVFDPFSWPKTALLLVFLLAAFCVLIYRQGDRKRADKFVIAFLCALGVFFIFGVVLRAAGQFALMELMPTRSFPLFAPLFFFWYLARAYSEGRFSPPANALAATAFACMLLWTSPVAIANDQLHQTAESWRADVDTTEDAFKWIGANTPNGTVVIAPPWRQDFWWQSRRAQVVSWNFPTYSNLGEWRRRVEMLAGDTPRAKDGTTRTEFYYSLSKEKIDLIASQTGAEYLVTDSDYPYATVFRTGETRVYKLR